MERAGVAIDIPLLGEISKRMEGELRSLEQRIWAEAGEEFNVNSPVKLAQILFEKLKYPSSKKTAKTAEAAPPKKQQPAKAGPVELTPADMKKVSGGLPRGGWKPE